MNLTKKRYAPRDKTFACRETTYLVSLLQTVPFLLIRPTYEISDSSRPKIDRSGTALA